jgi:hypothetical protein
MLEFNYSRFLGANLAFDNTSHQISQLILHNQCAAELLIIHPN